MPVKKEKTQKPKPAPRKKPIAPVEKLVVAEIEPAEVLKTEVLKTESLQIKPVEAVKVILDLDPQRYLENVGRRKTATARVRAFYIPEEKRSNAQIQITVNERPYLNYFKILELQKIVDAPLRKLKLQDVFSATVKTSGGGFRGQAEAVRHGLSKILAKIDPEWHKRLKRSGFITRDPRAVERKKYGKHKARKGHQWHKR